MEELKEILLQHSKKYPLMEPTDAVKLIYQNEFGGGHLVCDREKCMAFLQREYASVEQGDGPLTEDIGNGICRVDLKALDGAGMSPDVLGDLFIESARRHKGCKEEFLKKLEILRSLTSNGIFGFSSAELEAYLSPYLAMGCPAVSHSEAYRKAYAPAYRIVGKELL